MTNLRIQGRHRSLLWNEIYETTLAWYILRPTLMALINPKLGSFNVTAKGGLVRKAYFDAQIARPYLFLLVLNLAGVAAGILRLWSTGSTGETQTIWFNLAWTAYNLVMLGAVVATASETKQVRRSHRVPRRSVPASSCPMAASCRARRSISPPAAWPCWTAGALGAGQQDRAGAEPPRSRTGRPGRGAA
jgi:cellulose synthase (UDP-forming)